MSGKKLCFAVIGDPISHSLSPAMHTRAFKAADLNAEYVAIRVESSEIAKFADFARKNLDGFNVTVPHKSAIIPFLDSSSDLARLSDSVNTVKIEGGLMTGDSTDGYGFEASIRENFGVLPQGSTFMMVGAGGTARALSFHFLSAGLAKLLIANRSVERGMELVGDLRAEHGADRVEFSLLSDDPKISKMASESSLVIQASSLGLRDDDPSPLKREFFVKGKFYCDTIYKETAFLRFAKDADCRFAGGLGMLLHQGAKSFEIWTGLKAPIEEMRDELERCRALAGK